METEASEESMSTAYDEIVAMMERAKCEHRRELNRQLFASGSDTVRPYRVTWRSRCRLRILRVRSYFVTLHKALRGDDPYDVEWDDY